MQDKIIKVFAGNKFFEYVAEFRYLGMTLTNQKCMYV
jgi:hypothetical protein